MPLEQACLDTVRSVPSKYLTLRKLEGREVVTSGVGKRETLVSVTLRPLFFISVSRQQNDEFPKFSTKASSSFIEYCVLPP